MAAGDSYSVDRVVPIPKGKGGDGQKYRIVAIYSLEDGMIASGFASYLSTLIDPCLITSTLAFRPPPGPGRPPPSHHDAIDLIDAFRAEHRDRPIWCAECDIQGFFDAICHDTVRRSLRHILERAPVAADTRLLDFIESLLDGYSFADDAVPEAHRRLTSKGISSPKFAEPLTACDASDVPRPVARYGIPQGSAMSCVLANVVLARADEACELVSCDLEREQGTRSLYVRYCDDIVILSTTRTGTERLLDTYLHQLRALRLPYHTPADSPYRGTRRRYGPKLWAGKSKKPYRWDAREVPWLAFVGYQLHRSGRIRVRRKSIDKEIAKQNKAVSEVLWDLRRQIDKAIKSGHCHELEHRMKTIQHRMQLHLLSIGAGTPAGRQPRVLRTGVSWVRGFKALLGREVNEQWLRELDRNRTAALCRLSATLNTWFRSQMMTAPRHPKRRRRSTSDPSLPEEFLIHHPGPNFSYARLLADPGRLDGEETP